jgi:signal transduction histidine kinase
MSRRLSAAQETERRAIARELHDEVGQSLTATRINLRDLEQQAAGGPLAQRLEHTSAIIADLLAKVRQMSLDLHPSVLDDLGLAPALRWCVRTRAAGSSMEVALDVPDDLPRFDESVEITLFRVFQEALSNALKHAQAQHVQVSLRQAGGRLALRIRDDGRGFDAEAARRRALSGMSLGLLGMQERVRLAGGEMTLESTPGKGTEINVTLPEQGR